MNGVADGIADVVYLLYRESGWNGSPMAARRADVEDRGGKQLVITSGVRQTVFSLAEVPVSAPARMTWCTGRALVWRATGAAR